MQQEKDVSNGFLRLVKAVEQQEWTMMPWLLGIGGEHLTSSSELASRRIHPSSMTSAESFVT